MGTDDRRTRLILVVIPFSDIAGIVAVAAG
jgi:hypothetical protein